MATTGKGYSSSLEANRPPVAIALPVGQEAIIGSIVKLDGRSSYDPENSALTYEWTFVQVPIGSLIEKYGFVLIEDDGAIVGFVPDVLGAYKIQLVVYDSNNLASAPTVVQVDTRVIIVANHQDICPDASFIWNYLSDFWAKVEGRRQFEKIWQASIQIIAADMLKAFQYDYNKSIQDIQEILQKRWLHYSPALPLDPATTSFVLADDTSGIGADSIELVTTTGLPIVPQPNFVKYIGVPKTERNLVAQGNGLAHSIGKIITFGDRAFTLSRVIETIKAVVHNKTGTFTIATSSLTDVPGTFSPGMVGYSVKVITGAFSGKSFPITAFISSSSVTLGVPAWAVTENNVEYTVLPAVPTHNAVYVSRTEVPPNQKNKPWRIGATLTSTSVNFEEQGVSTGDLLEAEIQRSDTNLTSTVRAQVTGVDAYKLSFALNVSDLINGEDSGGFSDEDQVRMSTELQVPGLFIAQDKTLIYSDQAGVIYSTVTSNKFKRAYYETPLTNASPINVGVFSITVKVVQVIRNKRIPLDKSVISIPILQEYICQPEVSEKEDGTFLIQTDGGTIERSYEPIILIENLDYLVDADRGVQGLCNIIIDDDVVEISFGDLLARNIRSGDGLELELVGIFQKYTITQVLDSEHLRITPTPTTTDTVRFRVVRRVLGNYIRFVHSVFTPKNPAPTRLWGEVTYFNNNPTIENNFGVLVGVSQEDLANSNANTSYRSAVAGLMYALSTGSTVANIHLASQILLGLPFSQRAGVIAEITPDYRLNDDGSPAIGRILINATDKKGVSLGTSNVYLYNRGRQIPDPNNVGKWLDAVPDFQGIAINTATGKEYTIGDTVAQFVPLTQGVHIQEYLSNPGWFNALISTGSSGLPLQIYHTFNLLINPDLVSNADIDLAAVYIKKSRPTYTRMRSILVKGVEDLVEMEDELDLTLKGTVFDQVSGSVTTAIKVDGRDLNNTLVEIPGTMYDNFIENDDIETVQGSATVTAASGGFINPRLAFLESHDTPFVRETDFLDIHSGPNAGRYEILSVISDTQVLLDLGANTFQTLTPNVNPLLAPRQPFTIYRPIRNPIWWGSVTVIGAMDNPSSVGPGLLSAGVSPGDLLVFSTGATTWSRQYRIKDISSNLVGNQVMTLTIPITEATGTYVACIIREAFVEEFFRYLDHPVFIGGMQANIVAANQLVTFNAGVDGLILAQVNPGDIISCPNNQSLRVIRNDGALGGLLVDQAPGFTDANMLVSIHRPNRGNTPITTDILDRLPTDFAALTLQQSVTAAATNGLVTTAASKIVTTALNDNFITNYATLVGDFIVIMTGANSTVDTGHGPGVYLIEGFISPTQIRLANNITATQVVPGVRYKIVRKRPNER